MATAHTSKRTVRTVAGVGLVVLLAACGSGGSADVDATDTTKARTDTSTTALPAATSTTVQEQPTGPDEPLVDCDTAAFRRVFGTKMAMDRCTATWAVGNTDRDTWNCPDAGCRQVNLYRLSGTWTKTAVCDTTQPLTYWKGSCYHEDMTPVVAADIPPPSVQCRLWPANTDINNIGITGCAVTKEVIAAMTSGRCTGWLNNEVLPLVKCDHGAGVKAAQRALRKAGMPTDIDGYFGPGTARAVYDWQKKNGVTPTGMIDLATWKALFPSNTGLDARKDANGDGTVTPDEL